MRIPRIIVTLSLLLAPVRALAQDPQDDPGTGTGTSSDWQIIYRLVDPENTSDRGRQMTFQDMTRYMNTARCQCRQPFEAEIRYSGQMANSEQVQISLGQDCANAVTNPRSQNRPCVRLATSSSQQLRNNTARLLFTPIWLAWGISREGGETIETAIPAGDCSEQETQGGIWMCSGSTDCRNGEFFMTGETNQNIPMDQTAQGIQVDYQPPLNPAGNITVEPGDEAVRIKWDAAVGSGINGFRVLCANENDQPAGVGKKLNPPSPSKNPDGTVYYTQQNLCPDGPFADNNFQVDDDLDEEIEEDTDGLDTDGSGSDDGEEPEEPEVPEEPSDEGGGGEPNFPDEGILSLNWDYVCSDHVSGNSSGATVTGLENGVEYTFLVVGYDQVGNPVVVGEPTVGVPQPTYDLWDACEVEGTCGKAGYCNVTTGPTNWAWFALPAGLALGLGLRRRRTQRRAR